MPRFAYVYQTFDWDWAAAETELQRALAIDPTNPEALNVAGMLSLYARPLGRRGAAISRGAGP